MATNKKAKKATKTKTPVKNKSAKKTVKKKLPAKKKISKKVVKKKTAAKKVKKTSKPASIMPKPKKATTKKKIITKTSIAKKTKAVPQKRITPVKKSKIVPAVKKPKAKLQALPKLGSEILKIKERLIAKRIDLLKLIQSSKSLVTDAGDLSFSNEIDLASSLEGREMLFQLTSRDRNELRLIKEALFRMNEGTFGACETCEEQIGLKRLQIMPLTPLCISCQEAAEKL